MNVTLGSTTEGYHFEAAALNECPYIDHQGQTGGISLNQPANGDMTAGQLQPALGTAALTPETRVTRPTGDGVKTIACHGFTLSSAHCCPIERRDSDLEVSQQ